MASRKPESTIDALAVLFPGGATARYDVEGGCRNLLTGRLTVCVADEGRSLLFAVDQKKNEAWFARLPEGGQLPADGTLFFAGHLPRRMLSAEETAGKVCGKVFRFRNE